jgi:hemerythrin
MTIVDVSPITWSDEFCTGVPEVDEQHRILVNTLNEANASLTDESSLEQFELITRDLLSYALYHFETEEELMKQYGYAEHKAEECNNHLQEHRNFSSTVVGMREGFKLGKRVKRDELLSFLNNWLVNHILHTDKRLGRFIAEQRGRAGHCSPVSSR